MSEEKLKWFEFYAKYISLAVAGIWTLSIGAEWVQKEILLVDLETKQHKLETMKLGREGLYPRASTEISINLNNEPWGDNKELCHLTGQYSIENTGEYPISISSVTFYLYEKHLVKEGDLKNKKVVSYSLSPNLEKLTPIFKEKMIVQETINKENRIERSFGFAIKYDKNALYSVIAKAQGGIIGFEQVEEDTYRFRDNDLTHVSGLHSICTNDSNK